MTENDEDWSELLEESHKVHLYLEVTDLKHFIFNRWVILRLWWANVLACDSLKRTMSSKVNPEDANLNSELKTTK